MEKLTKKEMDKIIRNLDIDLKNKKEVRKLMYCLNKFIYVNKNNYYWIYEEEYKKFRKYSEDNFFWVYEGISGNEEEYKKFRNNFVKEKLNINNFKKIIESDEIVEIFFEELVKVSDIHVILNNNKILSLYELKNRFQYIYIIRNLKKQDRDFEFEEQ